MSSVTFSPSVGGDGSTVTDDSNATTGLDGGGHRTRFVPALAQVVAVAANTVTKAGEAAASALAAAGSASTAEDQVGLTTAAGAAQVALAAAHVATASAQATASATSASQAATSASQASASASSAATSATSAGTAATAAANTLISAVTQRPALRPSLSVDWTLKPTAAALTAAGWTISRAGEMTYFGAVPTKVAENLFVRSADFGNTRWTKASASVPAVTDESGLAGVVLTASATSGYHSMYQTATAANLGGTTYRVRFLCKASEYTKAIVGDLSAGQAAACFDLSAGTILNTGSGATAALPGGSSAGTGYISSSITPHELGGGLYWCELVMTSAPAGTGWAPAVAGYPDSGATLDRYGAQYTGDGTSGIEIYAAQLQHNFDGDYVPTTDTPITQYANPLLTAATNELAYQHNANGECTGLLSYPAATNVCLHSQDLSQAVWEKAGLTVTQTKRLWAGSAPLWRVRKSDTAGSRSVGQVCFTPSDGSTWSVTVALMGDYWSNTTSADVGLLGVANGAWGTDADANAAILSGPGTLSKAQVGALHRITGLSLTEPTVIRVTRTYPLAESAARGVYIYPGTNASTTLGAAILATRVQVESGSRSTPYIPTTGGQATRAAQTVTLGGSSFAAVNNPAQGTLLARASVEDVVFPSGYVAASLTYDNSASFRHFIGNNGTTSGVLGFTAAKGATQAAPTVTSVGWGASPVTAAYSYRENNFQLAAGGVLSTLDTSGTIPVVNQLSTPSWVGLLQRTEIYPRAMTSTELAAITTPGVLV